MTENFKALISKIRLLGERTDFKLTSQREMILKILFNSKKPINTNEIKNDLEANFNIKTSTPTIYSFVNILEQCQIVDVLYLKKTKYFSLKDIRTQSYLVCEECAKIEMFLDKNLENELDSISSKYNFATYNHRIVLFGKCKECT